MQHWINISERGDLVRVLSYKIKHDNRNVKTIAQECGLSFTQVYDMMNVKVKRSHSIGAIIKVCDALNIKLYAHLEE